MYIIPFPLIPFQLPIKTIAESRRIFARGHYFHPRQDRYITLPIITYIYITYSSLEINRRGDRATFSDRERIPARNNSKLIGRDRGEEAPPSLKEEKERDRVQKTRASRWNSFVRYLLMLAGGKTSPRIRVPRIE